MFVIKLQKLFDMTKPRLVKVRALFYVFQHVTKEAAPILTQPLTPAKIQHFFEKQAFIEQKMILIFQRDTKNAWFINLLS